jgi:hypothetical protein
MNFKVVWTPEAEADLTKLWLASRWRHLITASADQLGVLLSKNPNDIGESRDLNKRVVFALPLAVEFDVDETERTVYVRAVWQVTKSAH